MVYVPPSHVDLQVIPQVRHLMGAGAPLDEPVQILLAPDDIPVFLSAARAYVPAHETSPQPEPIHGSGCGLTWRAACWAAVGECLERWAATPCCVQDGVRATSRVLGEEGIDPRRFALFSEWQYAGPHFHFRPVDDTSELTWVQGWSWTHGRPRYLPTFSVFLESCGGEGQCTFHSVSTGLACGLTEARTRLSGLCEVIERDAMMIAWLNGLELPRLQPPAVDRILAELYRRIASKHMQVTVLDATTDVGLPVRFALVENVPGTPAKAAMGMAAHPDPLVAHRKALLEACHTLNWLHQLEQKRPSLVRDDHSFHPRTFEDHVFLYAQEWATPWLDLWRCGPWRHEEVGKTDDEATPEQQFDRLVDRLAELGLEVLTVDVTPPEIATFGFHIVRAVVPGMIPLTPGRISCLGGARLDTVPHTMPWHARYGSDKWNPYAHPFP